MEKIGNAIMMIRVLKKGLTQSDLAERVGISKNAMCSIENGKSIPSSQTLKKLCNALGCTESLISIMAIDESELPTELRPVCRAFIAGLKELFKSSG